MANGFDLGSQPVYNRFGYQTSPTYGPNVMFGQGPAGVSNPMPQQTPWSAEAFLGQRGLPTTTPSGEYLGGARSQGDLAKAVERNYGVGLAQWTGMPSEERSAMYNRLNRMSMDQIFDPETGLPTRLPRSPQEAQQFQLEGARRARLMQQSQLRQALSTLQEGVGLAREDLQARERNRAAALATTRYGLGLTQRSSPFGLAAMMSPLLQQQAQIYMQQPQNLAGATQPFLSQQAGLRGAQQYDPGDYSYFLRGDAYQGGGGGYGMPQYGISPRQGGLY